MASALKVSYILIATGSVCTPSLNIVLFQDEDARAKSEAVKLVGSLSKAGYFNFSLYDTKPGDEDKPYKEIVSFSVEQPEPVVTVKDK